MRWMVTITVAVSSGCGHGSDSDAGPDLGVCGNGVIEVVEQCDDGGRVDGDGCSATCRTPTCRDGIIDPPVFAMDGGESGQDAEWHWNGEMWCFPDADAIAVIDTNVARFWTGDVNGDGAPDVVGLDLDTEELVVIENDGTGRFEESGRTFIPGVVGPQGVLVDLDGDDDLDFAEAGNPAGISTWINDGTGTYSAGEVVAIDHTDQGAIAFGDFNEDGDADLVTSGWGMGSFEVPDYYGSGTHLEERYGAFVAIVLRADGGTLESQPPIWFPEGDTTECPGQRLAVGDIDADGRIDVALTSGCALRVLLNGDDGFAEGFSIETMRFVDVIVGDWSDATVPDLIGQSEGTVFQWLWEATGTMSRVEWNLGGDGATMALAAQPGSDRLTLIVGRTNSISYGYNGINGVLGGGGYTTLDDQGVDFSEFAVADLNVDGQPDYVCRPAGNVTDLAVMLLEP